MGAGTRTASPGWLPGDVRPRGYSHRVTLALPTERDLLALRLVNQRIVAAGSSPAEVVAGLGAVQAQDYRAALWAVGLRVHGATEAVIEQTIAERAIVRTWPMRGTLHFVPPKDARWMLELLTPRVIAGAARRHRELELDDRVFGRSRELLTEALQGGRSVRRDKAMALLEAAGISTAGQRGYHVLWMLAQEGVLCLGPLDGKQQTFVLLDDWVPESRRLERDEALAELARRYFTGHGPATLQDFVWWSGLRVADARAGLEAAAGSLERVSLEGNDYWMAEVAPGADAAATIRRSTFVLLPGYDEFLIGYRDRSAALDPAHVGKLIPSANGAMKATIVAHGRVMGTWRRTIKKGEVLVEASPFAALGATQEAAFRAAARRYAGFLGLALAS
jgi:hypothetical protein